MENHEAPSSSSETIGAYLRDRRMSRDIGLEEVSAATGISNTILEALENDDREQLPAEVYVRAFYKKYAEFLGLDPEEIQEKYQQQAGSLKKVGSRFNFSPVITLKRKDENRLFEFISRLFLPIALIVLGVLLYWIYSNYLSSYNLLGIYREYFPAFCSLLPSSVSDLFC